MGIYSTLKHWLRHLVGKDLPKAVEIPDDTSLRLRRFLEQSRRAGRAGYQASRHDVGKFMKHGRQSKHYRRQIKAKIQPNEED